MSKRAPEQIRQANLEKAPTGEFTHAINCHLNQIGEIESKARVEDCLEKGYAPRGYALADFTVIRTGGLWHLFHIPRNPHPECWGYHPANEHWFGHAVSRDLDTWITLDPVLANDPSLPQENGHLWAPFVLEHEGTFYMYYAGVGERVSQRLAWPNSALAAHPPSPPYQTMCMATSKDPELQKWTRYKGNPILAGSDWHWHNPDGTVHNIRDPHVVWVGSHFLMAYTAMYKNGCPAVGGMVSTDLLHWEDIGPILYRPMPPYPWHPESVNIQPLADGRWAMLPSCSPGLEYRISRDPHDWHESTPTLVEYVDGEGKQPAGIEVLRRRDEEGRWLVAWFEVENNRLFIGELDLSSTPWRMHRIRDRRELSDWHASSNEHQEPGENRQPASYSV